MRRVLWLPVNRYWLMSRMTTSDSTSWETTLISSSLFISHNWHPCHSSRSAPDSLEWFTPGRTIEYTWISTDILCSDIISISELSRVCKYSRLYTISCVYSKLKSSVRSLSAPHTLIMKHSFSSPLDDNPFIEADSLYRILCYKWSN